MSRTLKPGEGEAPGIFLRAPFEPASITFGIFGGRPAALTIHRDGRFTVGEGWQAGKAAEAVFAALRPMLRDYLGGRDEAAELEADAERGAAAVAAAFDEVARREHIAARLRRVREFVEAEVEQRGSAGALMSDYQDEAAEALAELDAVLDELAGNG